MTGSQEEAATYKSAKLALVKAIRSAKDKSWKDLCDLVETDTWDVLYKLVLNRLTRRTPIPGLNIPGRIEHIIRGLFPIQPINPPEPLNIFEDTSHPLIDKEEIKLASASLKNNTAPGLEGITDEVIKHLVKRYPEPFVATYNCCVRKGKFPKPSAEVQIGST